MPPGQSVEASDLPAAFEEARRRVLAGPEFSGVYTSPLWPVPAPADHPSWKCAVLQRRVEGGAEHWGHLYLVVSPPGVPVEVEEIREPTGTSGWPHPPVEELTPGNGAVGRVRFFLRARTPPGPEPLRRFTAALQAHWPLSR